MLKIKKLIICLLLLFIFPLGVHAASGSIKVTSSSTIAVGNSVTVTVTLAADVSLGSWQMLLDYDSSYLSLTSSTSEGGGSMMAGTLTNGAKSKTYTYKFKTLKTGSTQISVNSYMALDYVNMEKISLSSTPKTITIKTQADIEASYSKDNDLESLGVEGFELTPEFDADVLEYTVNVPEDTKEIKINAEENDYRASVSGTGTFEVTQGINTFDVVVRAQNGSEKTYKVLVNVIDENPINVTIDETNYTVVKLKEQLTIPTGFIESTLKINDVDIPSFYNDKLNLTLVGLKDTKGDVKLYIYNEKENKYSSYNVINSGTLLIIPSEDIKHIEGYNEYKIDINDFTLNVLKVDNDSKYAVIYGRNLLTGDEGYYKYDIENKGLITYDDELVTNLQETSTLYFYIICGFSGILVLLFIIIIHLLRKKKGTKKTKGSKKKKNDFDLDL